MINSGDLEYVAILAVIALECAVIMFYGSVVPLLSSQI